MADITQIDADTAARIGRECATNDGEANGSHLDRIIVELLGELDLRETLTAMLAVDCWRA